MENKSRASPLRHQVRDLNRTLLRVSAGAVALLAALGLDPALAQTHDHQGMQTAQDTTAAPPPQTPADASAPAVSYHSATIFTLRTGIAEGRMVYIGVGGDIDGKVNPTLMVHEGELVQINLINGEGAEHDVVLDQYAARSAVVVGKNASSTFSFLANKVGNFAYFCSIPGHRAAGMEGVIQVMPGPRSGMATDAADIVRDPADLPGPIGQRPPQ
ncbi:MAG: cupredoxin domain-containing protein, partial [Mesorhizobium sp.]|nr:cupredoxin domain-containing protein [Mesorhizobium sp.]